MADESGDAALPEGVQAAIRRNRKIEAIKLLREEWNIGLKEAKEIVEAHWDASRGIGATADVQRPQMESGIGRVVWAVIAVAAAYALFKHFG
jgi:ribosomal protein L7/L12